MKLFWQKAEVQKFEHAKDFAEEYNIGKKDFILASKSTYEAYFAALGLEAHVEYKSKYGKGEPTDEMIDALLADFRKTDCDRIIAIGGGAVIDMAKILVLAGDYSAEEIFGRKVPLKRAKTLIAVPTTCGAGSEVSNVSIAEFTKLHTKMGLAVDEIYADRAVLIPELLTGLPYSFFATSAIDAFIHAIESYVSPKATLYTQMFSMKAMEMIMEGFRKIAEHGEANYQFLTAVFAKYQELDPDGRIKELNSFLSNVLECDADLVYVEIGKLLDQIIARKPLHEYGMREEEIESFAKTVEETQQRLLNQSYVKLTWQQMAEIYKELY